MMGNNQKEYFGLNSLLNLKEVVDEFNGSKIFLVTGRQSFEACGARPIIDKVCAGKSVYHFSDFQTNPDLKDIRRGIVEFRRLAPDIVIAIGGGSVLDMAKAINALASQEEEPEDYIVGNKNLINPGCPLIAIPTTSGSGSEATCFAVVYIDGVKYSLADKSILPTVAIVDPQLTFSLSTSQIAISGADALCQAIESYWATGSTEESKDYAERALKIILNHLKLAVLTKAESSLIAISEGAHLAGKAINISKTTACHALSYPLTIHLNIPHGQAVALTLPSVLRYNYQVQANDNNDQRGFLYVRQTIEDLIGIFRVKTVDEGVKMLEQLFIDIGFDLKISDPKKELISIDVLLNEVSLERLNNNPRQLTRLEAHKILEHIL